ncbi:hypothetical protein AALO_G00094510 [Alosa alosa]|uniref:Ig-like domain-containing protein n=1 Tax=Alosa alosa TaxID=278164 RepID=A0AAV6GSA9_9TELE|nr:hypothetical protein AALO_G00094510 [Alosa alosa]
MSRVMPHIPPVFLLLFQILYASRGRFGITSQKWEVKFTRRHVCAVTGSSVVMPCSFTHPTGLMVSKVYWRYRPNHNSRFTNITDGNPKYKGRMQYFWNKNNRKNKTNCTFKLSKLMMSDNGEYFTRIETEDSIEKWMSGSKVTLSVKELSVGVPDPVIEGSVVKLICNNICSSIYEPTVIWRKNGQDLPVKQTNNNELILQSVSTEHEGNYSCALKQHEDHPSKPVELNVMFPPRVPSVSVSPHSQTLEGASVTLTCNSDANPPVENYTWFNRNGSIVSKLDTGKYYNIGNVSSEHTGDYYCEAKNLYGASNSTDLYLDVHYAPRKLSASLNHSGKIAEDSSVTLTCSSDANPPVENYTWYRRTAAETGGPSNVYDNSTNIPLTSDPAQRVDAGDQDDVQYASVQFKSSRGQQVPVYSTVQKFKPHPQQQEEVEYAAVNFSRPTAATQ